MDSILEYLKGAGQQFDADIAEELQMSLEQVRLDIQRLSATGAVMSCFVTRYRASEKCEGWICRLSGFIPPPAPGRRANPKKT